MLIVMAWRNLWRNKRRTLITVASILAAVSLATTMRALQKGAYADIVNNAVRYSSGYIQIHANGYWESPSINKSLLSGDTLWHVLQNERNISLAVPRLESFALISSGLRTKGVEVIGTDPSIENKMTALSEKITRGAYMADSDTSILIGSGLAEYLHAGVGDAVVLLGQGYHGSTAAGKYRVKGIFSFPIENINNGLVYLPLPVAQALFHVPERLTSVSVMLNDPDKIDVTTLALRNDLGNIWEVMQWPTMNKILVQEIESDNASGLIMLAILYIVIAFGVFGTILMMTVERRKEFAVMIALGMKKAYLTSMLCVETVLLGGLGVLSGYIVALPLLFYLHLHPIHISGSTAELYQQFGFAPVIKVSLEPSIFFYQGFVVFIIAVASAVYPMWYAGKFRVAESLK
jgi:ABC-type lipoprotein release transport system permease subunit